MKTYLRKCNRYIKWLKNKRMRGFKKHIILISILLCLLVLIMILIIITKEAEKKHIKTYHHRRIFKKAYKISRTNFYPQNLTKDQMKTIETRLLERKKYAKTYCSNNNDTNRVNAKEFLINRQYHLIWCNVFKAASTSWFYNFNLMANYSKQYLQKSSVVPLHLARKAYPRPKPKELFRAKKDSISFMIVRHPFERLASAYISKFTHYSAEDTKYERTGQMIIDLYRENEFVPPENFPQDVPVFEEFVAYLLWIYRNSKELDIHWTPYSKFCTPCQYDFDYILKMESLQEEQQYLIEKANLSDIIKPVHLNYDYEKFNYYDSIYDMYSRLTLSQIDELYEIYELDFRMFNYSRDEYDELVRYKIDDNVEFEVEPSIQPNFKQIKKGHEWVDHNIKIKLDDIY